MAASVHTRRRAGVQRWVTSRAQPRRTTLPCSCRRECRRECRQGLDNAATLRAALGTVRYLSRGHAQPRGLGYEPPVHHKWPAQQCCTMYHTTHRQCRRSWETTAVGRYSMAPIPGATMIRVVARVPVGVPSRGKDASYLVPSQAVLDRRLS